MLRLSLRFRCPALQPCRVTIACPVCQTENDIAQGVTRTYGKIVGEQATKIMKVYIAAPYSMKDTIRAEAEELMAIGIEVTCSWIHEPHKPSTQMSELTHEQHQQYALQDVDDVCAADVLVFHTDPTKTIVRGGRHVEFGMAVILGRLRNIPIVVVGEERENIFHHLPQVTHVSTWYEAKQRLLALTFIL